MVNYLSVHSTTQAHNASFFLIISIVREQKQYYSWIRVQRIGI